MNLTEFKRLAGLSNLYEMEGADRSTHPNTIEYGVQEMIKGKSPKVAAKNTVKKLAGSANMFLGSPTEPVQIDADVLETALWDRLAEFTIKALGSIKPGKEHYALDNTIQHFRQSPKARTELKTRMNAKAGRNLFPEDDVS
jgi:hypothetical protein